MGRECDAGGPSVRQYGMAVRSVGRLEMKIGAKRMAYPGDDPENGPKYMQQWTGKEWICFVHKPVWDEDREQIICKNCWAYICDDDGKRRKR